MSIRVVDSTGLNPADVNGRPVVVLIADAINQQVRAEFKEAWGLNVPRVVASNDGSVNVTVELHADIPEAPGALGYHTTDANGLPLIKIGVNAILANGGDWLLLALSVASVVSHEVLETLADWAANRWADRGDGTQWALEDADPVEGDSYVQMTWGVPVTVSNFVHPAFFDPGAVGPWDHMGLCTGPFVDRATGYHIEQVDGQAKSVFGAEMPAWRQAAKAASSRTAARLAVNPPVPYVGPPRSDPEPPGLPAEPPLTV